VLAAAAYGVARLLYPVASHWYNTWTGQVQQQAAAAEQQQQKLQATLDAMQASNQQLAEAIGSLNDTLKQMAAAKAEEDASWRMMGDFGAAGIAGSTYGNRCGACQSSALWLSFPRQRSKDMPDREVAACSRCCTVLHMVSARVMSCELTSEGLLAEHAVVHASCVSCCASVASLHESACSLPRKLTLGLLLNLLADSLTLLADTSIAHAALLCCVAAARWARWQATHGGPPQQLRMPTA
jgi:hypothetical protein